VCVVVLIVRCRTQEETLVPYTTTALSQSDTTDYRRNGMTAHHVSSFDCRGAMDLITSSLLRSAIATLRAYSRRSDEREQVVNSCRTVSSKLCSIRIWKTQDWRLRHKRGREYLVQMRSLTCVNIVYRIEQRNHEACKLVEIPHDNILARCALTRPNHACASFSDRIRESLKIRSQSGRHLRHGLSQSTRALSNMLYLYHQTAFTSQEMR
jgi:hypothetical protein